MNDIYYCVECFGAMYVTSGQEIQELVCSKCGHVEREVPKPIRTEISEVDDT